MKDLDSSAARLAGCLGFQTTASLHALFSNTNAPTKRVISDYIADRQGGFGAPPEFPNKFRSIKAPTVIEAVEHAGHYTQLLLDDKPPALASPNYMLTRINDLAVNSQLRVAPFSFDALETFLAWKVLIFFYTSVHRRKDSAPTNWHKVPAIAPTHINSKGKAATTSISVPTSRVSQLENALARFDNAIAEAAQDDPAQLNAALPDVISDSAYKTLVVGLGTALDRPTTARLNRPALSHTDLGYLHGSLCNERFLTNSLLQYHPPIPRGDGMTHGYATKTISASEAHNTGIEASDLTSSDDLLSDDPSRGDISTKPPVTPVDPREQLTVSAIPPLFDAALDVLKLPLATESHAELNPPNSFELPPTYLKPWQVTALGWMHLQEASPLHGGILADACGLGKTLTALSLIWTTNQLLPAVDAPPGTFAPSLILVPNALVDTWTSEIDRHFGDALQLIVFFGSTTRTSDRRRKSQIVGTLEELHNHLNQLHSSDSITGLTVVLSSYQTWARRTTYEVDAEGAPLSHPLVSSPPSRPAISGRQISHADIDEDEDQLSDQEQEAIEEAVDEAVDETMDDATHLSDLASSGHNEDPFGTARRALAQLQDAQSPGEDQPRRASRTRYFANRVETTFARIICDEGHRVKTISSRQHQSVAHLQRSSTWFLTATPMWNKPFDFCGYLSLLWSNDFIPEPESVDPEHLTDVAEPESALHDYTTWSAVSPLPDTGRPYHLLSPVQLLTLGRGGHLSTDVGFHVLPVILRLTCLAREPGHLMVGHGNASVTIGADIPPLAISTVELRYTRTAQLDHDKSYGTLASTLHGPPTESAASGPSQDGQAGSINWATYRQLCHIAVYPKMDLFLRNSAHSVLAAEITSYGDWGDDCGFGLFFARTVQDRSVDLPTSRMAVARYLAYDCPRLRFLLHLLWTEGTLAESGNRPRFLVYCNWPCTRWLVEMFLAALGVDFVVIRAGMSLDARTTAIQRFTNLASTTTVLLTTYNCGALGLNMHAQCSRVVLMEAPQNYNSVFQTVGRIHRLGQTHPQKAWLLFQDHTIQRLMEYNSTRKILPQIAAQFRPWLQTQIPSVAAHAPVAQSAAIQAAAAQSAAARVAGRLSSPLPAAQPNITPSASPTLSSQYDDNSSDPPPKKPVSDVLHTTAAIDRVDMDRIAYGLLAEILGIAPGMPSRLDMGEHHDLGLLGETAGGIQYSTRGAPMAVNPAHRTPQKRAPSQPQLHGGRPSKTSRQE
ncbi:Helicase, C-terminal [Penicillium expansum]|nr:Helicase, C-terminal [Penicillium expansum]KGO65290.1 Helicase, C-terminal [Penicillium expansum]